MIGGMSRATSETQWNQLDCVRAAFTGPDADAIVHGKHKDLTISNLTFVASAGRLHNRLNGWLNEVFVDRDLELNFSEQIDRGFLATIDAQLPFLPSKALAIHDRQAKDFNFC
jgi:hypothetical protein